MVIDPLRLSNSVVAITGGWGDIGQATARRLSREGASVVLLDRRSDSVLSSELSANQKVSYVQCDVTDRASVESAFAGVIDRHKRLDVAIANAGMVANEPFLDMNFSNLKTTMEVNFFGAFHTAQVVARLMMKQQLSERGVRGKILFTGSWVQDMPWPGGTSYISSKSAVKMMAKTMAQELAIHSIRVNILSPGIVMAGLSKKLYDSDPIFRGQVGKAIPLEDMQSAESVADAYAFLCSSDSDYMTGTSMLVDGGLTLVKRD
jgi:NAD(P)-dependent dehydrogenase (short-subunit alcohol dehydrogenase family)